MCIDGEKTIPLWLGNVWLGKGISGSGQADGINNFRQFIEWTN